ncbi:MAG: hypothetical protein ACD_28C00063G0016 [uncultured bacterium]|nr:MAG: hypothetical protein ACD_28C00063G0016 [uncultured bacterium]KKT75106.1 MAG: hypothetical protein UW70_C0039G0037 [Candidatus Peregrinibacteria bacterium GW2011_GWA2_44_7]
MGKVIDFRTKKRLDEPEEIPNAEPTYTKREDRPEFPESDEMLGVLQSFLSRSLPSSPGFPPDISGFLLSPTF